MTILQRITGGKANVRVYNQMRMTAAILGPGFIIAGIVGLFGFGTTTSGGKVLTGIERVITDILLVIFGFLICYARLTILREKRTYDKKQT